MQTDIVQQLLRRLSVAKIADVERESPCGAYRIKRWRLLKI